MHREHQPKMAIRSCKTLIFHHIVHQECRSPVPLFVESERPLLRPSTFITRVMPLFESNDLSVFFCFRLKLSSMKPSFTRRLSRLALWLFVEFLVLIAAVSVSVLADSSGRLRQITPAGCYCGCAQSKTSAGCAKMCELPKYASRWWAVTCAKPHITTPTEKSGAGPRLPHPGRAERAANQESGSPRILTHTQN